MWLSMTAMWTAMMVPMMLPSLAPRLMQWRPRRFAMIAAGAYFLVWIICGAVIYPPTMNWPLTRYASVIMISAAIIQFTPWKVRELNACRPSECPSDMRGAWRCGVKLGINCALCCAGYTAILLAVGAMNVIAMIVIGAAITIERLAPRPVLVARAFGVAMLAMSIVYR